ncbi:MAG TPA: mechanosensitive ion channel family protein [Kofleriaceae bacterium]|nr:mechanosensitive ion channel family protein [Kofleriaceae bacterium]
MTPEIAWAGGLAVAIVITAAGVNVFAPSARGRLRILTILYVLYLIALGSAHLLRVGGQAEWADRTVILADVLRAFTLVGTAGLILFRLFFAGLHISVPTIASDLLVGLGYIIATVGVFWDHGLDPVGAVATGAAVSAVLAISLQSTLGNILGGVALQLDGSIHEGDWIQLENGRQGRIRSVRWRHTLIETRDWSTMVVPNSVLLQNSFTILGWRDGAPAPQRMWVYFNVDFRFAPTQVIDVVTNALLDSPIENVAPDPKPSVVCMDFSRDGKDSVALYAARYWIMDLAPDDPTNSRVRGRIYTALKRAGIPLAVPAIANLVQINDREREHTHVAREHDSRMVALANVHLFKSLTQDELRVIAEGLTAMLYVKGEAITHQGKVAHYLYVLTKGSVEIRKRNPDDITAEARVIAKLDAPEIFGEMGLMTGAPRGADVYALTDVECYRVDKPTFERVLLARPQIAKELAEKLATRRSNNEKVDQMSPEQREKHQKSEAEKILIGIKDFFGL